MAGVILNNSSTPSTPASGFTEVFTDTSTKRLKSIDDAGNVFDYGSVSTPVDVPNGGTGNTTLAIHGLLIGNAANPINVSNVGTTYQPLLGTGGDPAFSDPVITSTLTDGASVALDAATGVQWLTVKYRLAAAGNRTIQVPTNPINGQKIIIEHFASGGARTLTLTTGSSGAFRFGSDITALTQTASGKTDYIGCVYNGTDSRWDVVAYTKGF